MKNLFKALAEFQRICPKITLSKKGYNYSYAPLNDLLSSIKSALLNCGLVVNQKHTVIDGLQGIETTLFHIESGEFDKSFSIIPKFEYVAKERKDRYNNVVMFHVAKGFEDINANEAQALGSFITYLRRYDIACILGIVADEDTDGNGKDFNEYYSNAKVKKPLAQKPVKKVESKINTPTPTPTPKPKLSSKDADKWEKARNWTFKNGFAHLINTYDISQDDKDLMKRELWQLCKEYALKYGVDELFAKFPMSEEAQIKLINQIAEMQS